MRKAVQGNHKEGLVRLSVNEAERLYNGGKYILIDDGKSRERVSRLRDMVTGKHRGFAVTMEGRPVFYSLIL